MPHSGKGHKTHGLYHYNLQPAMGELQRAPELHHKGPTKVRRSAEAMFLYRLRTLVTHQPRSPD